MIPSLGAFSNRGKPLSPPSASSGPPAGRGAASLRGGLAEGASHARRPNRGREREAGEKGSARIAATEVESCPRRTEITQLEVQSVTIAGKEEWAKQPNRDHSYSESAGAYWIPSSADRIPPIHLTARTFSLHTRTSPSRAAPVAEVRVLLTLASASNRRQRESYH